MERELDPVIVVEDEAGGDWKPLDLTPLFAATRSAASANELDDLAGGCDLPAGTQTA